jgi:O-antigen ligase
MRRRALAAGGTALIVMPGVLAFFSGGFFDEPRLVAALVAWALVLVVALVSPRPLPVSAAGRTALAALALLTAWSILSLLWAPLGDRAQDDAQRLLLCLGYFAAALALLRVAPLRAALEPALALSTFVVVAYGLSERVLPGLFDLERSASAAGRLEQPLTYWNAMGLAAALGFVLAARVAGDPSRPWALRAGLAAAGVPLGLGIYLSFARGALAALAVGLLVLVVLAPERRSQLWSVLVLVAGSALAALVASGLPSVESLDGSSSGEGLLMLTVLALLAVAAGLLAPRAPGWRLALPTAARSRPGLLAAGAILVVVAAGGAVAAFERKPEASTPVTGADPGRLRSIESNRYRYWDVALHTFADHPLAGAGAGAFAVEWLKLPDRPDAASDAHSLYLETAAELGVVGVALLLLMIGGVAAAGVRLQRLDPGACAGPAAGLAAWTLHAGLDWDWEMPAVALTALLLAAALVAWGEEAAAA